MLIPLFWKSVNLHACGHIENILCDSYFVEFSYDPTCNYYDREKYGCRNFHVTKLPLFMLRLLSSLCSSLHMLVFVCLENLFKPHDEYEIDNSVCNIIESGFGRVSTLGPTYLENVQAYEIFDKSGFGEVMTLVNVNTTILEECQLRMHVDRVENMLCDSYIVEFSYDSTCNYYDRVKYGCRNFHDNKLPLVMLRLLLFLSSSLLSVSKPADLG